MYRKLYTENGCAYLNVPAVVNFQLTTQCPLNCPFCFVNKKYDKEIDKTLLFQYLQDLKEMGTNCIVFGGGEPMIYPFIYDAVKEAKKNNFFVKIATSGVGCTYNKLRRLKEFGLDELHISLNSIKKEINQLSRDGYEHALNTINIAYKIKQKYLLNYVAQNNSINYLAETIEYVEKLGAKGVNIIREKVPCFCDETELYTKDNLIKLSDIVKNSSLPVYIEECFCELGFLVNNKNLSPLQGCAAGRVMMSISGDGSFRPCSHLNTKNEDTSSVQEYWLSSNILYKLRKNKLDGVQCGKCENNEKCCTCQALFIDQTENIYNDRPVCSLFKPNRPASSCQ